MEIEKARHKLQHNSAYVRRETVISLAEQESPPIELLITAMRDEDENVRQAAIDALLHIGEAAIGPLVAALESNKPPTSGLGQILVRIGQPAIMPLLESMTNYDRLWDSNAPAVIRGMGESAVETLLAALEDEREEIRQAAQHVMKFNLEWNSSIETLLTLLDKTRGEMRGHIIGSLGDTTKHSKDEQAASAAIETLDRLLSDKEHGFEAALALAHAGDERALGLLSQLHNIPDAGMRGRTVHALGELGGEQATQLVAQALSDPDGLVRYEAVRALGQIRTPKVVQPLIEALKDDRTHYSAIEALQNVGAEAVEPLIAALESTTDEVVSWGILWALRKIDDPQAQAVVEARLQQTSPQRV